MDKKGITLSVLLFLVFLVLYYLYPQSNFGKLAFLFVLVWLVGAIVLQGLVKIPADPPHKGVLTVFGKRHDEILDEGWHFLVFYPWYEGFIPVKVTKVNQDLAVEKVRTPDMAELEIPVSITWTPDFESNEALLKYLNCGSENGVKTILEDIIHERLREWAASSDEGPKNWEEAIGAREEAVAVLLAAVLETEQLTIIPFDIAPYTVLAKYYSRELGLPPRKPTNIELKMWGEKQGEKWEAWKKLEKELEKLDDTKKEKLIDALKIRRQEIIGARQGNGRFKKPDLGIRINRLNIGEIRPTGELAKAAEKLAKERRDRKAERYELREISKSINELEKTHKISTEQALEIAQTERSKVTKRVNEQKLNISEETQGFLKEVLPATLEKIFGKRGSEKETQESPNIDDEIKKLMKEKGLSKEQAKEVLLHKKEVNGNA